MNGEMDGTGNHLLSIQEPVFRIEKRLVNSVVGQKKTKKQSSQVQILATVSHIYTVSISHWKIKLS